MSNSQNLIVVAITIVTTIFLVALYHYLVILPTLVSLDSSNTPSQNAVMQNQQEDSVPPLTEPEISQFRDDFLAIDQLTYDLEQISAALDDDALSDQDLVVLEIEYDKILEQLNNLME